MESRDQEIREPGNPLLSALNRIEGEIEAKYRDTTGDTATARKDAITLVATHSAWLRIQSYMSPEFAIPEDEEIYVREADASIEAAKRGDWRPIKVYLQKNVAQVYLRGAAAREKLRDFYPQYPIQSGESTEDDAKAYLNLANSLGV